MMEDVFLFEIRYDFIYPTEQLYQFAEFLSIVISPFPVSFEESVCTKNFYHYYINIVMPSRDGAGGDMGTEEGERDFLLASIQRWL